jgi:hypothetical protein
MQVLVWSGLFLLLSVSGSAVELGDLIGMPIAFNIHAGVLALAALVVVSGIALIVFAPQDVGPPKAAGTSAAG